MMPSDDDEPENFEDWTPPSPGDATSRAEIEKQWLRTTAMLEVAFDAGDKELHDKAIATLIVILDSVLPRLD